MSTKKKPAEIAFPKKDLLNSKRFRNERDLVSALLEDGKEYTVSEVEVMITKYMKGKVE